MENERNLVEHESMLDSIDESSAEDNFDDESISTNALEDIRNINVRYAILRISGRIRKAQSDWKG